jgi:hypothetical protein
MSKAKTFKILTHWITGKGGKILSEGKVYPASAFVGDAAKEFLAKGYIEEVKEKSSKPDPKPADDAADDAAEKQPVFVTAEGKEVFYESDCKKTDIIAELEKRGVEFDSSDKKEVLFHKLQ